MSLFLGLFLALLHLQCLFSITNAKCGGYFRIEADGGLCTQIKPAMYQIQDVPVILGWDGKGSPVDRNLATNRVDDTAFQTQYRVKRDIVDAHSNVGMFTEVDERPANQATHRIRPVNRIINYFRPRRISGRMFTLNRRRVGDGTFIEIDPSELGYLIEKQDHPTVQQNVTSTTRDLLERTLQRKAVSGETVQAEKGKPSEVPVKTSHSEKFESQLNKNIPKNGAESESRSTHILPSSGAELHLTSSSASPVQFTAKIGDKAFGRQPEQPHQQQHIHSYNYKNERPVQKALIYKGGEQSTSQTRNSSNHTPHINNVNSTPSQSEAFVNISGLGLSSGFYAYPPKLLPAPSCFYNPTGYVCCNIDLNNLMQETYARLITNTNFDRCNIALVARTLQSVAEQRFGRKFECLVGLDDFAQKISFSDNLVCKIEVDGKYILAYATKESDEYFE